MDYIIRDAVPEDSDKLIELASLTPMKGTIQLRIDRKPDFFKLLYLSESFIMLVAENNNQQITGCFAATKSSMHINGKETPVYYLRDFKVHPDYKGSALAYQLVKKMHQRLLKEGADFLFCTMAAGNDAVIPFLKGRAGIPAFTEAANYNVYQLLPVYNSKLPLNTQVSDTSQLAHFFNENFTHYNIKPANISPDEFNDSVHFVDANNSNIHAAIAAFDPYPYKQNIVTGYSFSISILLTALRFLKLFMRLPLLPKKNVPLKILYAKYYACIKGKEKNLKDVIRQLLHDAFIKNFHLVAIAADEKDADMNKLLKPLSRFVFKSTLLVTSLQKSEYVVNSIKQGICFEDYSLV